MVSAQLIKELREKTGAGMLDCKKALAENDGDLEKATDWLREKGISKAAKKSSRIASEGLANIVVKDNQAVVLEVNCETDFVAKNPEFQNLVTTIGEAIINNQVKTVEEALSIKVNNETINDLIINKTAKIGEKLSFRRFDYLEKTSDETFGTYIHLGGKIAVLIVATGREEIAKDIAMHVAAMAPSHLCRADVTSEEIEKEANILKEQAISEGKPAEIAEKMVKGRIEKFFKEICLLEQPFVKNQDQTIEQFLNENSSKVLKMVRFEVGEGLEKRQEDFAEEVAKQMKSN